MMKKLFRVTAIALIASSAAFADIARPDNSEGKSPKPKASYETTLDIRLRADEKDARLIIPKSQIKLLRAQLESLDNGVDSSTAAVTSSGFSGTQTIMSGLFLSLAIGFGGMWFIRSAKNPTANKGVIAAVLLSCITSATFVFANAGPPAEARSITGKMFSQAMHIYGFGWGKIKVETTDDDDRITLIVPNPKTSPSPSEE